MQMKNDNIAAALKVAKASYDTAVEQNFTAAGGSEMGKEAVREAVGTAGKTLFEGEGAGKRLAVQDQLVSNPEPEKAALVLENARRDLNNSGHVNRQLQQAFLDGFEQDLAKREPAFAELKAPVKSR
jgi:hypothetical protein